MIERTYRNRIYPSHPSLYTPGVLEHDLQALEANACALLARVAGWLPAKKDAACLDVACGAGSLLHALHSAGYANLHGVDYSAQQVSVAKQICPAVEHGDAIAYLKDHPGQFDLITAFDIIEHFDKDEVLAFLDAIFAALKPGGRLIVQTPNAESPWFGTLRYGDFTHEIAFTPESLNRVMKIVGFEGFSARECKPYVHGLKSLARAILWNVVRAGLMFWNLIETGDKGSGVLTRVFIAKADKPA